MKCSVPFDSHDDCKRFEQMWLKLKKYMLLYIFSKYISFCSFRYERLYFALQFAFQ